MSTHDPVPEPVPDSPGGGEHERANVTPLPDSPGGGQQQRPVPDSGSDSPGGGFERGTEESRGRPVGSLSRS